MNDKNGNQIQAARRRAGIGRVQLAVRSGLSLSTIRTAEQGLATAKTLAAIAKALGVGVDRLKPREAQP